MNIGIGIRSIRVKKGITQSQLAEITGLSPTSISQIEKGIKRPSTKNLTKICEALKVPEALVYLLAMDHEQIPEHMKHMHDLLFPSIRSMLLTILGVEDEGLDVSDTQDTEK